MVLDDVVEYEVVDGTRKEVHLDQILLNGAHICLLVPGGDPNM
jgi:small nuclear ribonucleoprotein (snRNP)-like protein